MKRLILLFALVLPVLSAHAQSANDLFQQALRLERSQGDLEGAIELYERVANETPDRSLSGRALIGLARAYENLGRAEAARVYERVLADYADMDQLAAEARAGYERTRRSVGDEAEAVTRRAETIDMGTEVESWGSSMSPSGRFIVAVSYDPPGVTYVNVQSGRKRVIPIDPGADGYGEYPRFSPDERTIALGWYPDQDRNHQDLILIDVDSGSYRKLLGATDYYGSRLNVDSLQGGIQPQDWMPDGSALLVLGWANPQVGDDVEELLLVPVDGSAPRVVAAPEGPDEYSWEFACIGHDGRYAFADFHERDVSSYIARIDLQTGDRESWRRSPGMNYHVRACTESGSVIYAAVNLGSKLIKAGGPTDLDGADDRTLKYAKPNDYGTLGSRNGDLPDWEGEGGWRLILFDVDPDTGEILSLGEQLTSRAVRGLAWSPSGSQLGWVNAQEKKVFLKSVEDGSTRSVATPFQGWQMRWLSESDLWLIEREGDLQVQGLQNWNTHLVDLDSGESELLLRADDANRLGVIERAPLSTEELVVWSANTQCLYRLGVKTLELGDYRCFQRGYEAPARANSGIILLPSSGDHFVFRGHPRAGGVEMGLLSKDGSELEIVHTDDESRGIVSWWLRDGRPGELLVGRNTRSRNMRPDFIERLDIETGTFEPMFKELFERFLVASMAVHPEGTKVAVHGRPMTLDTDSYHVTVTRNVMASE